MVAVRHVATLKIHVVRARAIAAAVLTVLVLGGIPGARLQDASRVPSGRAKRDAGQAQPFDAQIDVTVHDGPAGPGLFGSHVRILAVSDDVARPAAAGETDAAGRASFSGLPRGETWVLVEALGRARGSAHIFVSSGKRALSIDLRPGHDIGVSVHDDAGAAVAGSEIEVLSSDDPLPVGGRTGPDGLTRVPGLSAAPWRVTARAPGYESATARVDHEGDVAQIVLRKLGALAVHVIGLQGEPAAGARVSVAGATLWPARAAETDARGEVRLGGLAAGTYALRAVQGDNVSAIELGVELERGEEKRVELRLAAGRFASVEVADGEGDDANPIQGADVTLAEGGVSPFPIEAVTDAKGRARLGPVATGPATLGASAEGFVARGAVALSEPWPAVTRVVLVRAGTLVGEVVDARGDPVDGATLQVVGTDPGGGPIFDDPRRATFRGAHFDAMLPGALPLVPAGELGVTTGPVPPVPGALGVTGPWRPRGSLIARLDVEPWITRDDGTFSVSPASPGRVRVVVRHPQYVEAQSDTVSLAPGGQAHLHVVMHEGGALEGRVLDAEGQPVEGVTLLVSSSRGSLERTSRSASDGTFAFAALPDQVTLTASTVEEEAPDVRMTVSIPEGGHQEVTVRLPAARDPLPVRVVDDRGYPVETAQVSATSLAVASPLRVTSFTDADGQTAIPRARGLALRVEVQGPSCAPQIVTTDGSEETLRVELVPGEAAEGDVVTAASRDPVAGATLVLETPSGARRTRSDEQGQFRFTDLPPGAAKLRVAAEGFAPITEAVRIPDRRGKRPYTLERVELVAEGVVTGDVVDTAGEPVAGARVAVDHVPTWLLVGSSPANVAVTDDKGRFTLRELVEGSTTVEAYAPDRGRGRVSEVGVVSGHTTEGLHIVIAPEDDAGTVSLPASSGGVAVTLGETADPAQVVVVSVVDGSEAERGGILAGDLLLQVDGEPVTTMEAARARLNGPISDDVVLQLVRDGRTLTLRVARDEVRR